MLMYMSQKSLIHVNVKFSKQCNGDFNLLFLCSCISSTQTADTKFNKRYQHFEIKMSVEIP